MARQAIASPFVWPATRADKGIVAPVRSVRSIANGGALSATWGPSAGMSNSAAAAAGFGCTAGWGAAAGGGQRQGAMFKSSCLSASSPL